MKRSYVIPNIITAFSLSCGLFVIFKVSMSALGGETYQMVYSSALLIMLAAFADLLDGAVARVMHGESDFGCLFDSLSDSISFGVAPSVLFLKSLNLEPGHLLSFLAVMGGLLYTICGVLRLVRYSVKAYEVKESQEEKRAHNKRFAGLPIPAAAAVAISLNLMLNSPFMGRLFEIGDSAKALILIISMMVFGALMISSWPFPSLKSLHVRLSSFYMVVLSVVLAIFILYGVFYYFPIVLFIASFGYLVVGLVSGLWLMVIGKLK